MLPDTEPSTPFTTTIITLAFSVGLTGLAALLKVWLENKRLEKRDYRKTMIERIEHLEKQNDECHGRLAEMREENLVLHEKLRIVKRRLDELDS